MGQKPGGLVRRRAPLAPGREMVDGPRRSRPRRPMKPRPPRQSTISTWVFTLRMPLCRRSRRPAAGVPGSRARDSPRRARQVNERFRDPVPGRHQHRQGLGCRKAAASSRAPRPSSASTAASGRCGAQLRLLAAGWRMVAMGIAMLQHVTAGSASKSGQLRRHLGRDHGQRHRLRGPRPSSRSRAGLGATASSSRHQKVAVGPAPSGRARPASRCQASVIPASRASWRAVSAAPSRSQRRRGCGRGRRSAASMAAARRPGSMGGSIRLSRPRSARSRARRLCSLSAPSAKGRTKARAPAVRKSMTVL